MTVTMLIAIADIGRRRARFTEHTLTLDGGPAQTADCSRFHWLPGHWQRGTSMDVQVSRPHEPPPHPA
jgi:hypothetical protein